MSDYTLKYTGAEIDEILDNNYDSGWIDLTLSGNITNKDAAKPVQMRKIGKTIHLRGEVTPVETIAASDDDTTTQFAILPEGFRPSRAINVLQKGDSDTYWRLLIGTDGSLTFGRVSRANDKVTATTHTHSFTSSIAPGSSSVWEGSYTRTGYRAIAVLPRGPSGAGWTYANVLIDSPKVDGSTVTYKITIGNGGTVNRTTLAANYTILWSTYRYNSASAGDSYYIHISFTVDD